MESASVALAERKVGVHNETPGSEVECDGATKITLNRATDETGSEPAALGLLCITVEFDE